jgi:hypothetical protein
MALGIDINTIQGAIPDNLKKQGVDRISDLLIKKSEEIKSQIEPKLIQEIEKAKDISLCDNIDKLNQLIQTRNNIVDKLNLTSRFLDQTVAVFAGIATFLELLLLTKNILVTSKLIANIGVKFLPVTPGVVTSTVDDLGTAADVITFDNFGNSRLEKARNIVAGSSIAIALISIAIKSSILLLNSLDIELGKCGNTSNLTPIDPNLLKISSQVEQAEQTLNNSIYKGFTIEIETVPYTNAVNRYKAIGVNSDGIKLIETPLSFTTNQQTLINELKFIIDRDNLKAN